MGSRQLSNSGSTFVGLLSASFRCVVEVWKKCTKIRLQVRPVYAEYSAILIFSFIFLFFILYLFINQKMWKNWVGGQYTFKKRAITYRGWSKTYAPLREKVRNDLELIWPECVKIQLIWILFTEVGVLKCIYHWTLAFLVKKIGDRIQLYGDVWTVITVLPTAFSSHVFCWKWTY